MRVGGSNKINVLLNYRLAFSLLIIYSFFVVVIKEEPESEAYFLTTFTAL